MNAKKARGDIILYGIFTVVGVIFYKWIIPTQIYMSKTASAEPFSPDTFPNAVTILFILASLAGLILAIYHYCKAVKAEGKPVSEVTAADLRSLLNAEAARPAVARHRFGALSRFFDWCQDEGHVAANPCALVAKARRPRATRP